MSDASMVQSPKKDGEILRRLIMAQMLQRPELVLQHDFDPRVLANCVLYDPADEYKVSKE